MIEADLALYRAKEAGRKCAVLFSEEMREVSRSQKQLSDEKDRISFELLGSVFFDSADQDAIARLNEIQSRGINIEIDDFGSGHASINGLLAVHPDGLKIDRFLATAALDDERLIEILEAVVRIGKALHIKVVAEGVEQSSHAEMCKKIGCDQIQGYGISRPIPPDQIIEFARQNSSALLLEAAS